MGIPDTLPGLDSLDSPGLDSPGLDSPGLTEHAAPDFTPVDASGRRTASLLPAPYSLNRLAEHSGWPEASLRRYVQASPEGAELMEMRSFETAVIAARALKHGHDVTCIRAVNAVAYLSSVLWLVSSLGAARVLGTVAKVAAWLEDHPADKVVVSSIGQLALDANAR